jgi:hypothetical protein
MGEETEYFSFSNFHLRQPLCFFSHLSPCRLPLSEKKSFTKESYYLQKKALADRKIFFSSVFIFTVTD